MTELYNPKTVFTHAALLRQACAHCGRFPTAASRRSLGRVSVPVWPSTLSGRLRIVALVSRYPTNWLMRRGPICQRRQSAFQTLFMRRRFLFGISTRFQALSPSVRQVTHVLLTRPPLPRPPKGAQALDLHVLGTPPAFVLSQDQTLSAILYCACVAVLYVFSFQGSTSENPRPACVFRLSPPSLGLRLARAARSNIPRSHTAVNSAAR